MLTEAEYYTADWCIPCKTFKPVAMKAFAEKGISLRFFDIEENDLEAQMNHIHSVPTIIVYQKNGDGHSVEVDRIIGAFPSKALNQRLESIVG